MTRGKKVTYHCGHESHRFVSCSAEYSVYIRDKTDLPGLHNSTEFEYR